MLKIYDEKERLIKISYQLSPYQRRGEK